MKSSISKLEKPIADFVITLLIIFLTAQSLNFGQTKEVEHFTTDSPIYWAFKELHSKRIFPNYLSNQMNLNKFISPLAKKQEVWILNSNIKVQKNVPSLTLTSSLWSEPESRRVVLPVSLSDPSSGIEQRSVLSEFSCKWNKNEWWLEINGDLRVIT